MNAGFGSWLLGMSLGASALGGMLGMASGIFIVLAATTFGSALLYAISGFGFAVLAAPLFLLFLDPARAIQLVIIISTALSIVVLRGQLGAIAPWLLLGFDIMWYIDWQPPDSPRDPLTFPKQRGAYGYYDDHMLATARRCVSAPRKLARSAVSSRARLPSADPLYASRIFRYFMGALPF